MKKIISLALTLCFINLCIGTPVLAASVNVKTGTRVSIIIPYIKTSKNTIAGEKINAKVENDVKINGVTVFKEGDNAVLNVADVKKSGFVGSPGQILLINGHITDVNGEIHPIELYHQITGDEKTYPKVLLGVSIFFLWPLALFAFVKGGDAKILQHAPMEVSLRQDFVFSPQKL